MDQLVGQTINRYKIISLLGEGGMGAVYKARDVTLQRDVAFKVMHAQFARQPNFQERFLQEARTAARFDHPSIVKVYDFGSQQGMLYIVMEFVPGNNLGKLLRDLRTRNQWIVLPEAIQLVRQISLALDYIHQQGITHRDIKPDNIMLKPEPSDGLPYRPLLTDLGLAKLAEGGVFTQDGTSMGTPAYMSPEQALGKPTDRRSDVYSLGILLFELVVGRLPFQATTLTEAIRCHTQETPPTPQSLRPDVPAPLQAVILKAIEKDPANRFQTAADLATALAQNQPAPATVASTSPSPLEGAVSLITQLQQSADPLRGPSILKEFPAPPSDLSQDRIQIMEPDHTGRVFSIASVSITIGRDPDNIIVLLDQKSSRHHARIDFDGSQYRIVDLDSTNGTFLASARLLPGVPEIWTPDKPLRIGDAYLRLVRSQKAASVSSLGSSPATGVDPNLVRSSPGQGRVGVYLENAQLTADPGTPLSSSVTLLNQGSVVDHFKLAITGIPPAWLPTLPPPVQLLPGDQQTVVFTILPPRNPQSRAGRYPLTLRVSSQSAPDQVAEVKATLTVSAYSLFSSELHPSKIKANKISRITVSNNGNLQDNFSLKWSDPGDDLEFKPTQSTLTVAEGKSSATDFRVSPHKKRLIGGEQSFPFSIQVVSSTGASQVQNGEAIGTGIIPPWIIPLIVVLCLLLAGGAALIFGQVNAHNNQTTQTAVAQITSAAALINTQAQATQIQATQKAVPTIAATETATVPSALPTLAATLAPSPTAAFTATPADTFTPTSVPVGGGTGRIAFISDRSGTSDIYTIKADGSSLVQLTKGMAVEGELSWSPNGKQLAFVSKQNNQLQIFVINSDGSGLVNLSGNSSSNDVGPEWSPDGTKISYLSSQASTRDVFVVSPDGSGLTQLTNNNKDNSYVDWAPDSSKIALATNLGNENWEIFTINIDGSGLAQLTNDPAFDGAPKWSPDGQKMVFISSRGDNNFRAYIMNSDGSGQTRLSEEIATGINPAWSPNGKKIAFMTGLNGISFLTTINGDGSGLSRITTNKDSPGAFEWSPDSTHITLMSGYDIYVIKSDGSSRVRLTNNSGIDDGPAWQPHQ